MHNIGCVLFFIIISSMASCSSMRPLPISEPMEHKHAKTLSELRDYIRMYSDHYREQAINVRQSEYSASDISFLGTIAAIIGGMAGSPPAALAGGVVSVGGSTVSQRYQYTIQAKNYEGAADAMDCMEELVSPDEVKEEIVPIVNREILKIRTKLYKYQANVELREPDVDELRNSLRRVVENQNKFMQDNILRPQENNPDEKKMALKLELLKSQLDECVAKY